MIRLFLNMGLLLAVAGCGLIPEKVRHDDPRVVPLFKAMEAVDRRSKGFTPIASSDKLRLESRPRKRYDAMLHVYGLSSRTISFRKTPSGFKWIGEQEIFNGPRTYHSADGTFPEEIVITYETESENGIPPNKLRIEYLYPGPEQKVEMQHDLSLEKAKVILKKWGKISQEEP